MRTCCFCGTDCQILIDAHRDRHPHTSDTFNAGLCGHCGELLVINRQGVRKPTDAEYLELGQNDSVRIARHTWLMTHRPEAPGSTTVASIEDLVAKIPESLRDDPGTLKLVHGTAMLGAAIALREVRLLLESTNGYDEFFAAMAIFEHRLQRERDQMLADTADSQPLTTRSIQ